MKRYMLLAVLLSLASAMGASWPKVGPNYHPPKATLPDSYHQQASVGGTNTEAAVAGFVTVAGLRSRRIAFNAELVDITHAESVDRWRELLAGAGVRRAVASNDTVQRVRGGLTAGLFNVNKGSSGGSSLLTPFESSVYQLGFDASWEIDFFGGRRRALEAATADVTAIAEARRETLVSLLAEVARNYAELRGFQRRLEITNQNIKLQEDSLQLTRVRAEAGLGTQLDVERQAAQLHSTRSLVPTLEVAEIQAIHRLGVLVGEEPGTLLNELTQIKPLPTVPPAVPINDLTSCPKPVNSGPSGLLEVPMSNVLA